MFPFPWVSWVSVYSYYKLTNSTTSTHHCIKLLSEGSSHWRLYLVGGLPTVSMHKGSYWMIVFFGTVAAFELKTSATAKSISSNYVYAVGLNRMVSLWWLNYLIIFITARSSYASAVLGIVMLSVCPPVRLSVCLSHGCFVTKWKNILPIFS